MFHDDAMVHITNRIDQLDQVALQKRKDYYFETLEREIRSTFCRAIVLSAEGVSNLNLKELARLKDWGDQFCSDWEVLYCVRNPVDWVRSVVQELMKGGRTISEMRTQLPLPYYRRQIDIAVEVFGRDRVTVYSYDEARNYRGGIASHFLSLLGIGEVSHNPDNYTEVSQENQSMSYEASLVLDRLNILRPLFREDGLLGERRTGQEIFNLLRITGSPFRLSPDMEMQVREATAGERQWLKEACGVEFGEEQVKKSAERDFGVKSIDTIALLLSDLMNDLHHMTEMNDLRRTAEMHRRSLDENSSIA